MAFTNEQLERYSRHIILKEVGAKGQKKLLNQCTDHWSRRTWSTLQPCIWQQPVLEPSVLQMRMK